MNITSNIKWDKVMAREFSNTDVPAMSAGHVFVLSRLDRTKPLRLKSTKELVEYVGYAKPYQIIVRSLTAENPYDLTIITLTDLENVPEEDIHSSKSEHIYIKASTMPFEGAIQI